MDMLLFLSRPGRLVVGENILHEAIASAGLWDGPMPWLVLSDILVAGGREFVGLVLYAGTAEADAAGRLAAACDPKIVRYLPNDLAADVPRYEALRGSATSVLELRWSETDPDEERVAQLSEGWYYRPGDDPEIVAPWAWGYDGIDHILASERLVLPAHHY